MSKRIRHGSMLCVFLVAAGTLLAGASPASTAPRQIPVENVLTLKVQPKIAYRNLLTLGLLVRTRSDEPVTARGAIYTFNRKTGLRRLALASITTPAEVHRFRLKPTRAALGPNRNFCMFYRVSVTTAGGGGGAGGGCVKVIGRR